jgi:hypothetical protein
MSKRKPDTKKPRRGGARKADRSREVRLSEHPRARRQIKSARAWGALGGFALASYTAWHAGLPFFDVVLRGIEWGVIAYVAVWAAVQQIWRHLAVAEVRAAEKVIVERHQAALAEAEQIEAQETLALGRDGAG